MLSCFEDREAYVVVFYNKSIMLMIAHDSGTHSV